MTRQDERPARIKILSSQLAKHFNPDEKAVGPCACVGLECNNLRCALWWKYFLEQYDREQITLMIDLYRICKARMSYENTL